MKMIYIILSTYPDKSIKEKFSTTEYELAKEEFMNQINMLGVEPFCLIDEFFTNDNGSVYFIKFGHGEIIS